MSEEYLEKPVADAEEQRRPAAPDPEAGGEELASLPFDANEADAVGQHQEVSLDEEDYR